MRLGKRITALCLVAFLIMAPAVAITPSTDEKTEQSFQLPDTSLLEIRSNRHTQPELSVGKVANRLNSDGFVKKMENDRLEIWFREETDSIRITDKASGYTWGMLAEDKVDGLNNKWCAMANSLCTIEFYNDVYAEKRISLSDDTVSATYKWEDNAVHCTAYMERQKIGLSFTMLLNADSIRFSVDKDSIVEEGEYFIKSLYFVPFLGCTREDEMDGYMFIPDGPGALLRYAKSSNYVDGYEERIFGLDMGIDSLTEASDLQANRTNDYLVDAPQVTMPVFGVVHGAKQNAILAVVDGGEQYGNIVASVAGVVTDYNWVTCRFDYRQMYVHSTSASGEGVYQAQKNPTSMIPAVSYYFLTGDTADYSGMAVKYRELLTEQHILKEERRDTAIPLQLNVAGAEIKEGLLFNTTEVFTTAKNAQRFITELNQKDITNLTMVYQGWQKGGISGSKYNELGFESKLGGRTAFEKLRGMVTASGGRLYLQLNPVTANKDQIRLIADAATTISNSTARFIRPNTSVMYYEDFVLKPSKTVSLVESCYKSLTGFGLSFEQLGCRLYADYTRKAEITRARTEEAYKTLLAKAGETPLALSNANEYLWQYMSEYFDIPTVNSQYMYETDTVPFLQIVLKGSMDYYASFANQGFYSTTSVLKMLEYGCYPAFMVTESDNFSLTDTPLEDYFSLNFDDWKGTIQAVYTELNQALSQVEGQQIQEHQVLQSGVVKVMYENGTSIYVNYNTVPYVNGAVTVAAQGWFVERG